MHLHSRVEGSGEHKTQAVTLFFAAMEICHHDPKASCFLQQKNGMRETLEERLEVPASHRQ